MRWRYQHSDSNGVTLSIHDLQSALDEATAPWGVQVERVEVKDVRVPEQLQRAMAAEAEAARNARAKVIAAEGEHKSSRALKHAADIIAESPAALQVMKQFLLCMFGPISCLVLVAISTNSEQHFSRKQQHYCLPCPHRYHLSVYWTECE